MSSYRRCNGCGVDDGIDVDTGECSECGWPYKTIKALEAKLAAVEKLRDQWEKKADDKRDELKNYSEHSLEFQLLGDRCIWLQILADAITEILDD